MDKTYVKDIHDKDQVKSIFQVARKTSVSSKSGKPFLAVTLRDKTGELDARIWERIEDLEARFAKGDLVEVEGSVTTFQGRPQLKIDTLVKADPAGLDPAEFAGPARPAHDDRNLQAIGELVERLQDPNLKALLGSFLSDEAFTNDFRRAPAGKNVHHTRHGGLCEHTLSVMRLALRVAEHYPMADRELMLAGAFLHDVAKVRELSWERGGTEYTDEGRLVGHLVMGAQWIHERAARIDGFPPALEAHLVHIVLAHHGSHEFGSPRVPQTLEAMLVHYVDEMDSRVGSWLDIMQRDPNERWTDYQKLYDRQLFKGPAPTLHGRAPIERRRRSEKRRGREAAAHEAEQKGGEQKGEQKAAAAAPGRKPEATEHREPRERRERPERGAKKEEKLTFKPFAALSAAAPTEEESRPSEPAAPAPAEAIAAPAEPAAPTPTEPAAAEPSPREEEPASAQAPAEEPSKD